jgi:hypothetical protein
MKDRINNINNESLEKKVKPEEDIKPFLEDKSYEPDIFSHSFRWSNRIFRDRTTDALSMWALPYLMPQIEGHVVLGVYYIHMHSIQNDLTKSDIKHTYYHEQGHAKGYDEYLAEKHTDNNYRLAA